MYTVIMTNSEEEKDFVQIWFSLDHKRKVSDRACKWSLKKWEHSDSSDSDSIALLTPLMTPIFYFHKVISALMAPLTTPTLSVLKASLKSLFYLFIIYY